VSAMHYVQTAGRDGGVALVEGPAAGLSIEEIIKNGLPPLGVALQLISAVAGVLDIAESDGLSHGDIGPASVFLDETGAVSVDGYDAPRRRYAAPEQRADANADRYGLGALAFAMLGFKPMPSFPADRHDDAVYDAILEMQWDDVPEVMVGDIQWFVSRLLGKDPSRRPTALDVWRTFVAFASEFPDELVAWAATVQRGGGQRRQRVAAAPAPVAKPGAAGPVSVAGALGQKMSFGRGDSNPAKGATGFWTKEDLRRAAEAEDEDEPGAYTPAPGGGGVTGFWSTDQLKAMADGGDAPRPTRSSGAAAGAGKSFSSEAGDPAPRAAAMPKWETAAQGGDETIPLKRLDADQEGSWIAPMPAEIKGARTIRPEPPTFRPGDASVPPAPVRPVGPDMSGISGPVVIEPPPEPPASDTMRWVMIGVGTLLATSCLGFGLVFGGWWAFVRDQATSTPPAVESTGIKVAPTPLTVPPPAAGLTTPPAAGLTAPPAAGGGPATLTVLLPSVGKVTCRGQTKDVAGRLDWAFQASELPAECKISLDGKEKTLLINRTKTVECKVEGALLACTTK
jgi:hypothetical protein